MQWDELPTSFRAAEAETLAQAYGYALTYLEGISPLRSAERRFAAILIIMAASARRRRGEELDPVVAAHAVAAEILEVFLLLRTL